MKIAKVETCQKCKFYEDKLIDYNLPDNIKLVVVGESPGYYESLEGRPFVGESGKLLNNFLDAIGISRDNCYITNALKCFPGAGKSKKKIHEPDVRRCAKLFLDNELSITDNAPVIVLGNIAVKAVSERIFGKKKTLKELRNKVIFHNNRYFIFCAHPAYYLRQYGKNEASSKFTKDLVSLYRQVVESSPTISTENTKLPFEYITDADKAISFLEGLPGNSLLVFDIETNGKPFVMEDAIISCIGFCQVDKQDTIFVVSEKLDVVVKLLARHRLIAHNGKFDVNFIRKKFNVYLDLYFDTLLAAYAADQNRKEYNLESLVFGYVPHAALWRADTKSNKKASVLDGSALYEYNAIDVYATHELYKYYQGKITDDNFLFWELLMPASKFYMDMEICGAYIDRKRLEYVKSLCCKMLDVIKRQMLEFHEVKKFVAENGNDYNPLSPTQTLKLLRDYFCIKVENKKTGKLEPISSTKKDVLTKVEHPFATLLKKYRVISKIKSTYAEGLLQRLIPEPPYEKGYPSIFLHKTVTGRTSSAGLASDSASPIKRKKDDISFNIQNFPRGKLIRGAVIAPKDYVIVSFDYKTLEIMIAAAYSQEPVWLDFILGGKDFHSSMAALLFSKEIDEITKEERQMAKTLSFGLLYGGGPGLLVERFGITWERAQEIHDTYFARVPVLKSCIQNTIKFVEKNGFVKTPFGRYRYFDADAIEKGSHKREAFNTIIQATASDIMLLTAREIRQEMLSKGWWMEDVKPLATVHDSGSFYVLKEKVKEAVEIFSECAILRVRKYKPVAELLKNVPLCIDFKISNRWS